MNTSLQRKIHYLSLATLLAGGLGLLEGKWHETLAGGLICISSLAITAMLLPTLLKKGKTGPWNIYGFLIEFMLLLLLALMHVLAGHYPLSIILAILSFLPAIAWVKTR